MVIKCDPNEKRNLDGSKGLSGAKDCLVLRHPSELICVFEENIERGQGNESIRQIGTPRQWGYSTSVAV